MIFPWPYNSGSSLSPRFPFGREGDFPCFSFELRILRALGKKGGKEWSGMEMALDIHLEDQRKGHPLVEGRIRRLGGQHGQRVGRLGIALGSWQGEGTKDVMLFLDLSTVRH